MLATACAIRECAAPVSRDELNANSTSAWRTTPIE
jgi:hypothetical protein